MANDNAVKNGASSEVKDTRVVNTTVSKDQDVLIVNDATIHLLDQAFTMQDNFENESKFNRAFVLDAVRAHVKAECSRILASWDAAIAKTGKLHPTKTRVECEALLLEGRKARELKAMVDVAASLKRELS